MGCGGSKDVVVELPKTRTSSVPDMPGKKLDKEGLFSRPGSGPVGMAGDTKVGKKNKVNNQGSMEPIDMEEYSNRETLPRYDSSAKLIANEEIRKGSAASKTSQDSGISIDQSRMPLKPVPISSHSSPRLPSLEPVSGKSTADPNSPRAVPRLASEEILSQLNEIGIVPLRTSRCGSSLAFNIDLGHRKDSSEPNSLGKSETEIGSNEHQRMLPPLPPPRLARLQALPPIKTSMEDIEAKQKRAEQRRKSLTNREEKIRQKSEQLRQRRVSEAEMSEREDDMKEKFSQDIQSKLAQNELNKQRMKEKQEEKRRRNEERLKRVRLNRERMMSGGGYGERLDDSFSENIESGALNDSANSMKQDVFDGDPENESKEMESENSPYETQINGN